VKHLKRKLLFLGIALIAVLAIPIVAAALTKTQTIHIQGKTNYPRNLPAPTATPTQTPATQTVDFSTFFPNGTTFPSSGNGLLVNTVVVDPLSGHNGGWTPTCIVVKNDGNTPITINASLTNQNTPANMDLTLNCGYYGAIQGGYGADQATSQQPIQPGQTYYMSLIAFLTPNQYDYTPNAEFSYSYDVVVTATQA